MILVALRNSEKLEPHPNFDSSEGPFKTSNSWGLLGMVHATTYVGYVTDSDLAGKKLNLET